MSKIHILEADTNGNYAVALHIVVPIGNNSAGKSWKQCLIESGKNGGTSLTIGTNPGNITQEEADLIATGDMLEIRTSFLAESGGTTNNSLDEMSDQLIADYKNRIKIELKYYGYTKE